MAVHFHRASSFDEARTRIEQYLFDSVMELERNHERAIESVTRFGDSIDRLVETLEQMYQTPNPRDTYGEKSFPIRDGQYRVFFKISIRPTGDFDVTFIDVDDNRQSNLDRFPTHRIITFDDDPLLGNKQRK